jgi:hypothetical protein
VRDRATWLNAFTPSRAVSDPSGFAGRKKELQMLVDDLLTDGTIPVICGERGVGKTSLANQLARIAEGDAELLQRIDRDDVRLDADNCYATFVVSCSADVANKNTFVGHIANAIGADMARGGADMALELRKKVYENQLSIGGFRNLTVSEFERNDVPRQADAHPEDQLARVVSNLLGAGVRRVLIILDELDRIRDRQGLGDFLRRFSDRMKFLLIGVAGDSTQLVTDHPSIARQLHDIPLERMLPDEVEEIFSNAERYLSEHGLGITFNTEAKETIKARVHGHPWLAQLAGQEALKRALDQGATEVTHSIAAQAFDSIKAHQLNQVYRDTYERAVDNDANLDVVLRLCAKANKAGGIDLDVVTAVAERLRVHDPRSCVRTLTTVRHFGILTETVHAEEIPVTRFKDLLFCSYLLTSAAIFPIAGASLEEEWRRGP